MRYVLEQEAINKEPLSLRKFLAMPDGSRHFVFFPDAFSISNHTTFLFSFSPLKTLTNE